LSPLRLGAEEKITALARRFSSRRFAYSPDNTRGLSAAEPAPTYLLPRQSKKFRAAENAGGAKEKNSTKADHAKSNTLSENARARRH